ncbi:putative non-canonical purine NTP phosphatase [Lentibacillus sp. JNUCC-1]|uniref:DUF84 family protein n=1 Tax=Lentibacillus sp. JNUCC-1 TaxID=2654513 RepID=UPI0012E88553|nr:DUF84 family protein [Lentibacillus sp. JNUCC-1]MUV39279.1 putative non-canonical purine NTP phosphatase [Lentibacillus sp. JNUCC-1]
MKIIAGTQNLAKLTAIQTVFSDVKIDGVSVPSNVSAQPVSDEETLQGAVNRATQCTEKEANVYGIGLEGGVMQICGKLYLCNWGALKTPSGQLYTASGARIRLPESFNILLEGKVELGDLMDDYANKSNIRQHEGAIGIFTNGQVSRSDMFIHVVTLLKGQLTFYE